MLKRKGFLLTEIVIATGIVGIILSFFGSFFSQGKMLAKTCYFRAIAMEIVDGEMEVLMAGEWKTYKEGEHKYPIQAQSCKNLPEGEFILTIQKRHIKLEWKSLNYPRKLTIIRETDIP